jgi:hypothetical protein
LIDGVVSFMCGWALMERTGSADVLRILPLAARWEATYVDDDTSLEGAADAGDDA